MILLKADARHIPLKDETVQCVVTSPPYWGLRDYGLATWEGGSAECDHKGPPKASGKSGLKNDGRPPEQVGQNEYERAAFTPFREVCAKCGARRIDRGIGLERTPEEYVANIVQVFREVWRVLRKDGLVWLNLGDCYATGAGKVGDCPGGGKQGERFKMIGPARKQVPQTKHPAAAETIPVYQPNRMPLPGLKPKDLIGIPWRCAFALQSDGWYLRSDIIWAKPNPMPESVRDRPTKAHEYIFLLSKSQRYYYDQEAVREAHKPESIERTKYSWDGERARNFTGSPQTLDFSKMCHPNGRNLRSVWTIATQPFPGAHFATFPEALAERCIKAGSRPGDTVLDSFGGSGTTARVALKLGRRAVHLDLGYHELARTTRCTQIQRVMTCL